MRIFIFFNAILILLIGNLAQAFTLGSTNPSQGGWSTSSLTFTYNPANCPNTVDVPGAMNQGAAIWNTILSSLTINIGGASAKTQLTTGVGDPPVVVCDTTFTADSGLDGNSVSGYGRFATQGNTIVFGYILLNVEVGKTANLASLNQTQTNILLSHEMGHVLGLGHSADQSALMQYAPTSKSKLALAQDDIDGITYLYPRNETGGQGVLGCGLISDINGNNLPPPPKPLAVLVCLILLAAPVTLVAFFKLPEFA